MPEQDLIPMYLVCPRCNAVHIDKDGWENIPHKTHQCQVCFNLWRPFEFPTVGVERGTCRGRSDLHVKNSDCVEWWPEKNDVE